MDKARLGYWHLQVMFKTPAQQVHLFGTLLWEHFKFKECNLCAEIRQAERDRQDPRGAQQGADFLCQGGDVRNVPFSCGRANQAARQIPFIRMTQADVSATWPPAPMQLNQGEPLRAHAETDR